MTQEFAAAGNHSIVKIIFLKNKHIRNISIHFNDIEFGLILDTNKWKKELRDFWLVAFEPKKAVVLERKETDTEYTFIFSVNNDNILAFKRF